VGSQVRRPGNCAARVIRTLPPRPGSEGSSVGGALHPARRAVCDLNAVSRRFAEQGTPTAERVRRSPARRQRHAPAGRFNIQTMACRARSGGATGHGSTASPAPAAKKTTAYFGARFLTGFRLEARRKLLLQFLQALASAGPMRGQTTGFVDRVGWLLQVWSAQGG